MTARQLLDTVWLVGSGTDDTARTDSHDCHCYLVWDGRNGLLVDAGTGLGGEQWLANVTQVCDPSGLAGVLVTHYHADHAGGARLAAESALPVFGHPLTVSALAVGDEDGTQVSRAREVGIYPADYRLPAADLKAVSGGDQLSAGEVTVNVHDSPGHCDGHLTFSVVTCGRRVLFSGDCVFAGGRVSMQAIPDCRLDRYADTMVALADLDVDVLLPGHGDVVLERAGVDLKRAATSFRRLVPPPNFLVAWE